MFYFFIIVIFFCFYLLFCFNRRFFYFIGFFFIMVFFLSCIGFATTRVGNFDFCPTGVLLLNKDKDLSMIVNLEDWFRTPNFHPDFELQVIACNAEGRWIQLSFPEWYTGASKEGFWLVTVRDDNKLQFLTPKYLNLAHFDKEGYLRFYVIDVDSKYRFILPGEWETKRPRTEFAVPLHQNPQFSLLVADDSKYWIYGRYQWMSCDSFLKILQNGNPSHLRLVEMEEWHKNHATLQSSKLILFCFAAVSFLSYMVKYSS